MMNEEVFHIIEQAIRDGWTKLDLSGKNLISLPSQICEIENLTWLDLSCNKLRTLPKEIRKLRKLTWLDLSKNRIKSLPKSIGQLQNLTWLNLNKNGLINLPIGITQLNNLTWLYLNENRLKSLRREIYQLQNLGELHLRDNNLSDLPVEMIQLTHLTELDLNGNNLNIPENIIEESYKPNIILNFYKHLQEKQEEYLYEAKILIIGEGGAGKTSLAKKLQNQNYQLQQGEESTIGIDIYNWSYTEGNKQFRINIWDFSGQEIDYATHQFFLTEQSLYLLVADNRKEDTNFSYWLGIVELQSPHSPLLIIKNEKQNRQREIDESKLKSQFKGLKGILSTNLKTSKDFHKIITEIKHQILNLPHIGKPTLRNWIQIRETLERDNRNYISQQVFFNICQKNGFADRQDKLRLSKYLHLLGVFIHFQDDLFLNEIIFLKPSWLANAVYKILNNNQVISSQGRFKQEDIIDIWHGEEFETIRSNLLQLMLKFKLCYEIPDSSNSYIAPQLLECNQPEYTWDESDNLILRYRYDFMPRGILSKLIVEMHQLIYENCVWRNGVILSEDKTKAKVIESYQNYSGEISVHISGERKRDLLTRIDYELDKIHFKFNNLKYKKLVPCNCPNCKLNVKPNFYEFDKLKERITFHKFSIECAYPPYHEVDVLSLIDEVNLRHLLQDRRTEERNSKISVFNVIENIGKFVIQEQEDFPVSNTYQKNSGDGDNVAGNKITEES